MHVTPFSIGVFPHTPSLALTPTAMGWISTTLTLLVYLSITCYWFDLMAGFSFSASLFLRFTISLLRLNHTLEYIHDFLHALLQPMKLDSFIALVSQDLIVVLNDFI